MHNGWQLSNSTHLTTVAFTPMLGLHVMTAAVINFLTAWTVDTTCPHPGIAVCGKILPRLLRGWSSTSQLLSCFTLATTPRAVIHSSCRLTWISSVTDRYQCCLQIRLARTMPRRAGYPAELTWHGLIAKTHGPWS